MRKQRFPSYYDEKQAINFNSFKRSFNVVEPLLDGMVLGLVGVTLAGLFFAAYKQYKRGKQLGL